MGNTFKPEIIAFKKVIVVGWRESDRVSERLEFVRLGSVEGANISLLCSRFGISRKTGYKWLERWRVAGEAGLEDQSRRPKKTPGKTSDSMEDAVVELRRKHPAWGGRTLHKRLLKLGHKNVPSPSTITHILHRHGLISPQVSFDRKQPQPFERAAPNDLWQIDFKGDFQLSSGKRCYPLTILDDHSRYSIGIYACDNQRRQGVMDRFREVFSRYGIPRAIYVDNGNPWGNSRGPMRHSKLSVWLMRQDIEVIHGRPHYPQGRGKIERFHRTLKREVLQGRVLSNLKDAQSAFDPWRQIYNHERPHQALNYDVPSNRYRVSERPFREIRKEYEYSERFETRKVHVATGQLQFHSKTYKLSEALCGQRVGLAPTLQDGVWDIYYCRYLIGQLNQHEGKVNYNRRLIKSRSARLNQTAEDDGNTPK